MESGESLDAAGADDFVCARCAVKGNTCCQRTQVFITLGDIERVSAAVGDRDFYEYAVADPESRGEGEDPVWDRIFGSDGNRRILAHKGGKGRGDCLFLGERGCRLALTVRPLVCRLYPFEYDADTIKGVSAHHCPEPERNNQALMLALLGMNRDEAEEWRRMLYEEIEREFPE